MKPAAAPSALRVQAILGPGFQVLEFEESTRTSLEAAAAVGCHLDQIAKSLIFKASPSGRPVLAIMRGGSRLDEKKLANLLGEKIGKADADFVREATGFAIGGVPPVGHATQAVVYIDAGLSAYAAIWAAAGTPNAVFQLAPADLVALTGGTVADLAKA